MTPIGIMKKTRRTFLFRNQHKTSKGQSTVEFLSTLMFLIGFLFVFVKLAINYTNGYLLHWATYSASRSYLTFDDISSDNTGVLVNAKKQARNVFNSYTKLVPSLGGELKFNDPETGKNFIYVGAYTEFKQTFSLFAFVGGQDPLTFRTESFLGKEPTRQECLDRICKQFTQQLGNIRAGCPALENATYFDDGC